MQFNLSNLYSIDGPAFLLTQVCLVCPWVLYNGQITVLVFHTVVATINSIQSCFISFYLLKFRLSDVSMGQYEDREYSHLHCIPILSSVFCAVEFMRLPHSLCVAANILQENYNLKLETCIWRSHDHFVE